MLQVGLFHLKRESTRLPQVGPPTFPKSKAQRMRNGKAGVCGSFFTILASENDVLFEQ